MTAGTVAKGALDGFAEKFGAFLQGRDALDELALQRVLRAARQSGERFDRVLTKLGLIAEADIAGHLAAFLHMSEVKPAEAPLDAAMAELAPRKFLRINGVLPLKVEGDRLSVAVTDPFDDETIDALAYATGFTIERRLASPAVFEQLWAQAFGARPGAADGLGDDRRADEANEVDLQRLRDIANEAPVVRRVNQIVADAIEARASDIHIEPTPEGVRLRYRIDGALRTWTAAGPQGRRGRRASKSWRGSTSPSGACRRTGASSSACAAWTSTCASPPCRPCMARASCCAFSTAAAVASISPARLRARDHRHAAGL